MLAWNHTFMQWYQHTYQCKLAWTVSYFPCFHISTCLCVWICICICIYIYVHMHMHIHTWENAYAYAYAYTYMGECICICLCVWIWIGIYIHGQMHLLIIFVKTCGGKKGRAHHHEKKRCARSGRTDFFHLRICNELCFDSEMLSSLDLKMILFSTHQELALIFFCQFSDYILQTSQTLFFQLSWISTYFFWKIF